MTLQRFAAFLFLAGTMAAGASVAQTSQPQTTPAVQTPPPSVQILSAPQALPALRNPSTQSVPAQDQKPSTQAPLRWRDIQLGPKKFELKQLPDGALDPGIYLRLSANQEVCGTIVSYNFSQGENPRLGNVTTCTPVKSVRPLKVHHERDLPPSPTLLERIATQVLGNQVQKQP